MTVFSRTAIAASAGFLLVTCAMTSGCASRAVQTQHDAVAEALHAVESQPNRVVITVRSERHVQAALMSLEGLRGLDTPVESIRFLVFGEAIHALKQGSALEEKIQAALDSGVQISACALAMTALEIDPSTLMTGVDHVHHVFVEAARLQQHGWISLEY